MVVCLQFMGDYWLTHTRPLEFVEAIDAGVATLFQACTGMDVSACSEFARECIRLPMRMRGYGLRRAADQRSRQYTGAAFQIILPLLDRKDDTGCTIPSRFNLPAVIIP